MGGNGDPRTERIELADGNWADVRTTITVGDIRFQRTEAQARGFVDETLDLLALVERVVTQWSFGPVVTREVIDALLIEDALTLVTAIGAAASQRPNPSTPLSDGTGEGVKKVRVPRQVNGS